MVKSAKFSTLNSKGVKEFLAVFAIFLLVGSILLLSYNKGELVFNLNSVANTTLDEFFKLYTDIGLGGALAILAVVFLFIRYYYTILIAASLIGSGILVYLFKQVLFTSYKRPTKVYDIDLFPHIMECVQFHSHGSFPSGHTLTAFAGAIIIAMTSHRKGIGALTCVMAILVAVSRMYLLQHFFMDVFTGAAMGVMLVLGLHFWLGRYENKLSGNLIYTINKRQKQKVPDLKKA